MDAQQVYRAHRERTSNKSFSKSLSGQLVDFPKRETNSSFCGIPIGSPTISDLSIAVAGPVNLHTIQSTVENLDKRVEK